MNIVGLSETSNRRAGKNYVHGRKDERVKLFQFIQINLGEHLLVGFA